MLAKMNFMLGIPRSSKWKEPQIVRYQKVQSFIGTDEVPAAQLENGGQRLATLLVYL
jgi:hypothetical protein